MNKLSTKLVVSLLLLFVVVVIISTAIRTTIAYYQSISEIETSFEQLKESHLPTIRENVWTSDTERLQLQLDGIGHMPFFRHAKVVDQAGRLLAEAGTGGASSSISKRFDLAYQHRETNLKIGFLTITANDDAVRQKVVDQVTDILIETVFLSIALAIAAFFLIRQLVTRHLEHMARATRFFQTNKLDEPFSLANSLFDQQKAKPCDEISDLLNGLNTMRTALLASHKDLRDLNAGLEKEVDKRLTELRGSEQRFRTLTQVAPVGIFETNGAGDCIHVNQQWCDIAGMNAETARGTGWLDAVHPEDREMVFETWTSTAKQNEAFSLEYRFQRPDGSVSWVIGQAAANADEQGQVTGFVGTITDITHHKDMEHQLRQSQKMEAVGQLTGGVAHDFNNLLAVISGNVELLEDRLGSGNETIDTIHQAVTRGSELTQQLLAFSRRQPLRPQAIDLGDLVSNMSGLLTRTLGEIIEIETCAAPDLWAALADPGQVENAILNLAINARDAMASGGSLRIDCTNVHLDEADVPNDSEAGAGDYVMLAVSDTGDGMPADVLAHAFDPFFTTKKVGEGTGLGLSMVFGFTRQSGGDASIESEEGRGTTVKLYLPRSATAVSREALPKEVGVPHGGGETILVIEDDPNVRKLAVRMVDALGYRVIEVGDAAAANAVLTDGTPIDLVLSDVVLSGGTSGPEFIATARADIPDLKVIFMSGYPAETAKSAGLFSEDEILLKKPFRKHQLAEVLRTALD